MVTQQGLIGERFPAYARRVIDVLESAGYEAWAVGGWVRDALRGEAGHDVDVTTSASWQDSERVLSAAGIAVHQTGTAHGTVTAVCDGEPVEVTTYRVEEGYTDHRHPDVVRFVSNVHEDLARRDLTINAMAWHPTRGLLDPFGGQDDLREGIIRAVGDPEVRFGEDALRVLRAVRFSVRFGFDIEPTMQRALQKCAPQLAFVAQERVGQELSGIVSIGAVGRALREQPVVMCEALPELAACRGFDQKSVYHAYDVYDHIAHVCCACEAFTAGLARPELRWAALLHDVAKPATYSEDADGHGHFFDHPRQGSLVARRIMRRLAIPNEVSAATELLIRLHDEPMPATRKAIRRLLAKLAKTCPGREAPLAFSLFNLRRADAVSKVPKASTWAGEQDRYTALLREELAQGPVFNVRQLAVSGVDIMRECGIRPGPGVGMQLDVLLHAVIDGDVPNTRDDLIVWLRA